MSFIGGGECSSAGNPLRQFTKYVQDDKSLQQDRLAEHGLGSTHESFKTQRNGPFPLDKELDNFLNQSSHLTLDTNEFFGGQTLDNLSSEAPGPQQYEAWAAEFLIPRGDEFKTLPLSYTQLPGSLEKSDLPLPPDHFEEFKHVWRGQRQQRPHIQRYLSRSGNGAGVSNSALPRPAMVYTPLASGARGTAGPLDMGRGVFARMTARTAAAIPPRLDDSAAMATMGNGKERMLELDDKDWERQFAEIDQVSRQNDMLELDASVRAAMETDLEEFDRQILSDEPLATFSGEEAEEKNAWDMFEGYQTGHRDSQLGNYLFEKENIYRTFKDPFSEGMKIMSENGNLSLAALAFEAAVQKDSNHQEAWAALGDAQAQNEKETPAIRALEQALKLDPNNLSALMGLAISYTNEGYDATAYRTLERWLSVKYPQIISPQALTPESHLGFYDRQELREKVTELFIQAAQLSPHGAAMDPDVQVGLGVLFYGAEEHDKAVDCFEAALASTESGASNHPAQAHLLWSRLGATLANSGRSEEAIAAYAKALAHNPNFVRARYNLGVSCINMGCFREAAEHLLDALSMHHVVERAGADRLREILRGADDAEDAAIAAGLAADPDLAADLAAEVMIGMNHSTNLLETLRRTFNCMDRRDLADKVVVGVDVDALRAEFADTEEGGEWKGKARGQS